MANSKLVFSLTYLGPNGFSRHLVHFQVHDMDTRFGNDIYMSKNGWTVASSATVDIDFADRVIYLWGATPRISQRAPTVLTIRKETEREAVALLQDVLDALQDWAANYSGFGPGEPVTEEVRESLRMATPCEDTQEEPEYEGDDGAAPLTVDCFTAQRNVLR